MIETLYLVDGHAIAYRAYFALTAGQDTSRWMTPEGEPTAGTFGFASILLRLLGRQKVYPLIADGEYKAVKKYQHVVGEFPQVTSVRDDEQRHGDTVLALLD